jgi:hypothetical protein
VGLEPAADGDDFADLGTYECTSCGETQTRVFVRTQGIKLIDALDKADRIRAVDGHGDMNGDHPPEQTAKSALG